jgi:preprotein translocase subunit SecB
MSEQAAPENQFSIQKIYVKDLSFESPSAPEIFNFQSWDPKIELNLNGNNKQVADGIHEVVLSVTATVKNHEKTAFLIEVQQAGLFTMAGFKPEDMRYVLNSQCMTILFPYARELISDMTSRGGFPPLLLNPVNFDALFAKAMQEQQNAQEAGQAGESIKH